jgi:hypothetical protein
MARADFELSSSTEDGMFAYPSESIKALHLLSQEDTTCTLEAVVEEEKHIIRYWTPSGAEAERTTFDPELLFTCDDDLAKSEISGDPLNVSVLKEAISAAKVFLPSPKDVVPEYTKAIQVLDKEKFPAGDGYLYVADGVRAFYFKCSALEGRHFDLHGTHLSTFLSFASRCKGEIQLRRGDHFLFATCLDENGNGSVFGWPKYAKYHEKFSYYGLDRDGYLLRVNKARMMNALNLVRTELDSAKDKVKLTFDCEKKTIQIDVLDSSSKVKTVPLPVDVEKGDESWTCSLNLNHLTELFSGVRSGRVEFRVLLIPPSGNRKSKVGMFRTVDHFYLDKNGKVTSEVEGSAECTVTRFMPSKE